MKLITSAKALTLATLALGQVVMLGTSASANQPHLTRVSDTQVLVMTRDLDLDKVQDREKLKDRLERAARKVCRDGRNGSGRVYLERTCLDNAIKPHLERLRER